MAVTTAQPIELYTWSTPNGWKIPIMLEECGLPYRVVPVNIGKGEQMAPDFLAISPNNKIPAIVDPDGPGGAPISVFESGAILQYLGRKTGCLYPSDERARTAVDEWLFWQVGGLGPMLGQAHHFRIYAQDKIPYAIDRFTEEARRLYGVLDRRLAAHEYLADTYSIADIAALTWAKFHGKQGIELDALPMSAAGSRRSSPVRPCSAASPRSDRRRAVLSGTAIQVLRGPARLPGGTSCRPASLSCHRWGNGRAGTPVSSTIDAALCPQPGACCCSRASAASSGAGFRIRGEAGVLDAAGRAARRRSAGLRGRSCRPP